MTTYTIDKNIPKPIELRRKKYPFDEMKINDSFLVEIKCDVNQLAKKQNVYTAMWRYTQRNPDTKFTTATEEKGIRIWRIK